MKIRSPHEDTNDNKTSSLDELFARAKARMRARAGKILAGPMLAGAITLGGGLAAGCDVGPAIGTDQQADWVQYEGQRNTDMVSYAGQFWSECGNFGTRFGCSEVDVFIKLRVQPVQGANLDHKEVGVVYRNPFDSIERTAHGYYFSTLPDGLEEWHVPVTVPSWRDFFTFNAFYRDGAHNTYYDDNAGELHAVNAGPVNQIIRVDYWASDAVLDASGVHGKIELRVADLDYDKKISMLATVDGWNTVLTFEMGQPGDKNAWYWVRDVYGGELWEIDLDLPGDHQEMEYAVVYHHGVVNDATAYGFWANNGGMNYRLTRQVEVE